MPPLESVDAQNLLRITLLCKVIQDRALQGYSAEAYTEIKGALLSCFYALDKVKKVNFGGQCDPPCVTCGAECVCP